MEVELTEVSAESQKGPTYAEGLSTVEAERRLKIDGRNVLAAGEKPSFLQILLTQAKSTIFLLTSLAALISFLTGDTTKGIILIGVVCFVCLGNAIGEFTAQDAGAALASKSGDTAKVIRDGSEVEVDAADLVVGDVVVVSIGDIVPADILILESLDLQAMEAILTGEPHECSKTVELKDPSAPFASNMLYCMTDIVGGRGKGEVFATGMRSQVGLIAKRLQGAGKSKILSPLQTSINSLGTAIACIVLGAVVVATLVAFFTNYQNAGRPCRHGDHLCLLWGCLLRGIIMSVALIPHGLPFVVMVMLNIGSKEMGKRSARVSKVTAVDYLAATSAICSDKTGTLTEGKMTAQRVFGACREDDAIKECNIVFYPLKGLHPNGGIFKEEDLTTTARQTIDKSFCRKTTRQTFAQPGVPDIGMQLSGDVALRLSNASQADLHTQMVQAHLACGFLNCHATGLSQNDAEEWTIAGNMTEAAIKVAAAKGGFWDDREARYIWSRHELVHALEVPFNSKRKMAATVHKLPHADSVQLETLHFDSDITSVAIVKGAPDKIMPRLSAMIGWSNGQITVSGKAISSNELEMLQNKNGAYAREALRTLLLAIRPLTVEDIQLLQKCETADDRLSFLISDKLTFMSLWGIVDPPRTEVPPSVRECHEAGIRVVMITGDQLPTALAIGRQVGIIPDDGDADVCAATCADLHEESPVVRIATHRLSKRASQILDASNSKRASVTQGRNSTSSRGSRRGSRKLSVHDDRAEDTHEPAYRCEEEMELLTRRVSVWARAQPTDKVAIVDSLMAQGHIAAMTGDGVNDAPALTKASVGVSMGIAGTAVTQNAADLILGDDNFATIVAAIKEGRRIYMNAQKYTTCNMSMKGGECMSLLLAIAAGLPLPILPLQQILNLLTTHIICTLPFAWEEPEKYAMKVPPRNTKKDLVVPWVMWKYRWLPYIISQPVVVLFVLCLGTWMHTGHVFSYDLMGTSNPDDLVGTHACTFAGTLSDDKKFTRDHAPYHCMCRVYTSGLPFGAPLDLDQWGRVLDDGQLEQEMDFWSGHSGTLFERVNTPWPATGEVKSSEDERGEPHLVYRCQDEEGASHVCWTAKWASLPESARPVLPVEENCGALGAQIGQSMAYATIQLGEILTILSYRQDSCFVQNAFSNKQFNAALCFNLVMLLVFIYVQPVRRALHLRPLSFSRLLISCCFAGALLAVTEFFKMVFRSVKDAENIQLQKQALFQATGGTSRSEQDVEHLVPDDSKKQGLLQAGSARTVT